MKKPSAEEIIAVLVLALELAKLIGEWVIKEKGGTS